MVVYDRLAAFDLEIAKPLPEGFEDWRQHRPLGVSCAALHVLSGGKAVSVIWHGAEGRDGVLADRMSVEECRALARALEDLLCKGYGIITWNGLGFDFDILQEECGAGGWLNRLGWVAVGHLDPAFQMLCERGYMVSLDTAAKGMHIEGKMQGMGGDLAPILWTGHGDPSEDKRVAIKALGVVAGTRAAQNLVLQYVIQDVKTTLAVYQAIAEKGCLDWVSRSERANTWVPKVRTAETGDRRLLTAREAMALPLPDVSWMKSARPRSQYYRWLPF